MALSDFFKRKKEVVKEDSIDLLEDLLDKPIKYIPNEVNEYIKKIEKQNEALNKINELLEKEIELLNKQIEALEKMNELSEGKIERLDKENKELRYKVRDFKMRR